MRLSSTPKPSAPNQEVINTPVLALLPEGSQLDPLAALAQGLNAICVGPGGQEAAESRLENVATDVAMRLGLQVLFEGEGVVFYDSRFVDEGYAREKMREQFSVDHD